MFSKEKFTRFVIFLLVLIFILHVAAIYFSLYWKIWWFDNVLHFMGGVWLASVALWFIYFSGRIKEINIIPFSFLLIGIVAFSGLGGILWEFFEFLFDVFVAGKTNMDFAQLGVKDTMSDLFFDLLGGLAAGLVFLRKKKVEKAVPTYYFTGKKAEELDKLVDEGLKEHRAGKTIKASSLREAMNIYERKKDKRN